MRVLLLSKMGDGAGLAWRLSEEGHSVDLWIKSPGYSRMLRGVTNRVDSFRPYISRADLILCDTVGFSSLLPLLSSFNKPILPCNVFADALELDRRKGIEAFQRLKIPIPETYFFKSPAEAKTLKWDSPTGYIIKPSGNLDSALTYRCESQEIYQWALSMYKPDQELIVQCLIPPDSVVEVSTEGWFNGNDWLVPFSHTFEEKRFLSGNIGPATGCEGNIVITVQKPNRLIRETVLKFTEPLRRAGYRGPFDINTLVSKDQIYALEITPRFGYDAIEALTTGLEEPLGSFLFGVAMGVAKQIPIRPDFLIAVRASLPPYPHAKVSWLPEQERRSGMPIVGATDTDLKYTFFCDVMLEGDRLKYAASDGALLKATAFGRSVREARHRAYRVLENLKVPELQYRTDIGARVEKDLETLRSWGWL